MALVLICCSSCTWFAKTGPPSDPLYTQATKQFLNQDYPSAISAYTKYIESNRGSAGVAEAYYGRGMCYFAQGNATAARVDFDRCMRKTDDKELQASVLPRIGECYMREEKFHKAEEVYRRLLKKYQIVANKDDVLYLLGVACLRQAHWDEAEDYLGQVIRNYPYSSRKTLAQEKMPGVDRFFSVQAGAYQTRAKAEEVRRNLERRGFNAFVRTISRAGTTYYCVRSGRFSSWSEVKRYAERLRAAGVRDVMKVP